VVNLISGKMKMLGRGLSKINGIVEFMRSENNRFFHDFAVAAISKSIYWRVDYIRTKATKWWLKNR
jgi:hypothetical protein